MLEHPDESHLPSKAILSMEISHCPHTFVYKGVSSDSFHMDLRFSFVMQLSVSFYDSVVIVCLRSWVKENKCGF